jgi:hypothetical protein
LRSLAVGRRYANSSDDEHKSDADRNVFDGAVHDVKLLLANGAVMRFCSSTTYAEAAQQASAVSQSSLSLVSRVETSAGPAASQIPTSPKSHITRHHL